MGRTTPQQGNRDSWGSSACNNWAMSLLLVTHESSSQHAEPPGHPERVGRLSAVLEGVGASSVSVGDLEAPAVDRDILELVHSARYIDDLEAFCLRGGGGLDQDTYAVPASFNAALHAAGAGPAAVETLDAGGFDAGFVVVRPPGHHALRSSAMGFCLFNNIAVTAAYLRLRGERVAIVDWDVHHGNGTQNTFYDDPDVLYVSLHEFPFYPGTGWTDEVGGGRGIGTTVNIPLPAGTSADSYLAAFRRIVIPVLEQFSPDWILVSNGYDAHRLDPLGGMLLESRHYGWLAQSVVGQVPRSRVIAFLEGGYDLDALRDSSTATVEGLSGRAGGLDWPTEAVGSAGQVVNIAIDSLRPHWELR
jgi:acetoin utilization deacetylase AcuC-like enzyme